MDTDAYNVSIHHHHQLTAGKDDLVTLSYLSILFISVVPFLSKEQQAGNCIEEFYTPFITF
ncbi:hypothetical protein LZ31DRAFT_556418 [Colletotrichum somersetense]|nr:hypothetical protein LZ31DRAFT_556418 [Colletotrichum somersetense]